jgi:NAD(P)-dependent dehydrogenase (short-subunit alcohol dehydrogenase family)
MSDMPVDWSKKVVVITGASSGIGAACALALAERRTTLVLGARRMDKLQAMADKAKACGSQVIIAPCDVAIHENVVALVQSAKERFGRLDVAIANAGFGLRRKMLRGSLAGLVGPAAFAAARVSPEARAETLSLDDWGRLAAAVAGPATAQPPADGRGEGATNEETGQR